MWRRCSHRLAGTHQRLRGGDTRSRAFERRDLEETAPQANLLPAALCLLMAASFITAYLRPSVPCPIGVKISLPVLILAEPAQEASYVHVRCPKLSHMWALIPDALQYK